MQHSVLEVAGGKLSYWAYGSGTPLVFIHGSGTPGELWARDLEPLSSQYHVTVGQRTATTPPH